MSDSLLKIPGLEPIAYILYEGDYKARLSALIRNAPKNIASNTEWWKQLQSVTKASSEEIQKIRTQHIEIATEKMQKTGKVFDKLADTQVVGQDPKLQELMKVFAQNLANNNKNVEELVALQKQVQARIQKLDEIIRQKETELANSKRNATVTESKEIILEGFLSRTLSKVRQYLASDAFKKLLNLGEDGDKLAQLDAETIVRDTLQVVCTNAYTKLKESGINQRTLIKAYQRRKNRTSLMLLDKARKIVTGEDAPVTAEVVEPQEGPPPIDPKMMRPQGTPPVQKTKAMATEDGPTIDGPPSEGSSPEEKQPHNEIAMMIKMIDNARRKAKATGIDEFQAAENELLRLEEEGVDDVGVVRRLWDKYRERKRATQP